MFQQKDVAEYYNTTQNHYENWWGLKNNHSLHYGIWEPGIRTFSESLVNTNKTLLELASISKDDEVLDAGCGVGGAAVFIHEQTGAKVTGITLSERQLKTANALINESNLHEHVSFEVMDYTQTSFEDDSFDVIWACESISSAPDFTLFIKEAYRILKKGGRLVLSDFFITSDDQVDKHNWVKKWAATWGITDFSSVNRFKKELERYKFEVKSDLNKTDNIHKSAKRMYIASILGAIPSQLYNLFHPKVSRFAKGHYKTGYYQYKALKAKLWEYHVILAVK